jgi:hypothetical protein
MNANEKTGREMQIAESPIEGRLQRPHRTTTARIEIPEREVSHARPLMNDETKAGQQGVLEISRSLGGTLTVLESPVPSRGRKRESGSRGNGRQFPKAAAGRSLGVSAEVGETLADASDRYRAKYVEILRRFRAGKLVGKDGRIVTARLDAMTIAADEARRFDARP